MSSITTGPLLHILAIGSSSTEGIGASSPAFAYPAQLRRDLGAAWGIRAEVQNAGIGGERAPATVDRLTMSLQSKWPELVLWQVGTNDALTGEDEGQFASNLQRGISAVQDAHIDLVLIDPQYIATKDPTHYAHYVGIIADTGRKNHVPVFSRYAMMAAWAKQSPDMFMSMLAKDGLHMSDRGYGCLAERLAGDIAGRWGRSIQLVGGQTPHAPVAAAPRSAVLHNIAVTLPGGPS